MFISVEKHLKVYSLLPDVPKDRRIDKKLSIACRYAGIKRKQIAVYWSY